MTTKTVSFRKGDAVTLNPETCFTKEHGGGRDYPLSCWMDDEIGFIVGVRPTTEEEVAEWRASDESKGLNSAGETKLAPRWVGVRMHRNDTFTIVRGRARNTCTWGTPRGGFCLVRLSSGEEVFVRRELLQKV